MRSVRWAATIFHTPSPEDALLSWCLLPALASQNRVVEVEPVLGRLFTDDDAAPGAEPTALLTEAFWRRRFGSDPGILGRSLEIGEGHYTVVGITPAGFTGADLVPVDVFLELEARATIEFGSRDEWPTSRDWWWIQAVARLAPGVDPIAGDGATTAAFRAARSGGAPDRRMLSASLVVADGPEASTEIRLTRWLAGVSILVLLIACANVANLMLVRSTGRRQAIAVQRSLGLSGGRLVAQLLVESLVLAAIGGVAALLVAQWGGAVLRASLFPDVQFATAWSSWRLAVFTVLAVLVATCLTGLVPAVQSGQQDILTELKHGARGGSAGGVHLRSVFVAVQAGLTIVLVVGAALFLGSLRRALDVDLGFDPDVLFTAALELDGDPPPEEKVDLYYRALADVQRLPGVRSASFHVVGPFQGSIGAKVEAEGHDSIPRVRGGWPRVYPVGPDYFDALGIEVLRGRTFNDEDHAPCVRIVVASPERPLGSGRGRTRGGEEVRRRWRTTPSLTGGSFGRRWCSG